MAISTSTYNVERGDRVRDSITGYTGIVLARSEYLNGCVRFLVVSEKLEDGKSVDETFDAHQLEILEKGAVPAMAIADSTAGKVAPNLMPAPVKERAPVLTGGPRLASTTRPAIPRR